MKRFLKLFKCIWIPFYGILFVLLVIFSVSAAKFEIDKKQEVRSEKQETNTTGRISSIATTNQNQNAVTKTEGSTTSKPEGIKKITESKQSTVSSKQATSNQISTNSTIVKNVDMVYLKINSGPAAGYYQDDYLTGENAFSLMQRMAQKYNFTIKFTDYGGDLGKYIDCIGSLCRNNNYIPGVPYYSWMLYYNGVSSSVGASTLIVKKDDVVEWRYETY